MPGKYDKAVFLSLWTVFGFEHIFHKDVGYMSSVRCEISCWQQQLDCEWHAKPQNCEADFRVRNQLASDIDFAKPSKFFFSWVIRPKLQVPHFNFQVYPYGNMVHQNKMY